MRRVLDDLALMAPAWIRGQIQPEWAERYSKPFDTYRLPKSPAKRETLAKSIGRDGIHLLAALYDASAPPELRSLGSVGVLRRIWVQ
jgi:transposase